MIDYDKLKEAHDLLTQHVKDGIITATVYSNIPNGVYYRIQISGVSGTEVYTMHELMEKLKSLPTTVAKHKVGQKVWLLNNFNKPVAAEIPGIMAGDVELGFEDGTCRYGHLKELHHTLEELIDAQIAKWKLQKEEVQNTCRGEKAQVKTYTCEGDAGEVTTRAVMCSCDHLILMNADGKPLICEKCGCDMSRIQLEWGAR
jgi:hypothetical protein